MNFFWWIKEFCSPLQTSKKKQLRMARVCDITGKKPMSGFKVSKSNHKTKRKFNPNLFRKSFFVPELNQWINLKVSAAGLRTINKKGLYACLKELEKKGEIQLVSRNG